MPHPSLKYVSRNSLEHNWGTASWYAALRDAPFHAKRNHCSYFLFFHTCLLTPFCISTSVSEVCRRSASINGTQKTSATVRRQQHAVCACLCVWGVQTGQLHDWWWSHWLLPVFEASSQDWASGQGRLGQLICHRAGQSRLHKLHRPVKLHAGC